MYDIAKRTSCFVCSFGVWCISSLSLYIGPAGRVWLLGFWFVRRCLETTHLISIVYILGGMLSWGRLARLASERIGVFKPLLCNTYVLCLPSQTLPSFVDLADWPDSDVSSSWSWVDKYKCLKMRKSPTAALSSTFANTEKGGALAVSCPFQLTELASAQHLEPKFRMFVVAAADFIPVG